MKWKKVINPKIETLPEIEIKVDDIPWLTHPKLVGRQVRGWGNTVVVKTWLWVHTANYTLTGGTTWTFTISGIGFTSKLIQATASFYSSGYTSQSIGVWTATFDHNHRLSGYNYSDQRMAAFDNSYFLSLTSSSSSHSYAMNCAISSIGSDWVTFNVVSNDLPSDTLITFTFLWDLELT